MLNRIVLNRIALIGGLMLLPFGAQAAKQSKAAQVASQLRSLAKAPGSSLAGVTSISAKNVTFNKSGTKYTVAPVYKHIVSTGAFHAGAIALMQIKGSGKQVSGAFKITSEKLKVLSAPKSVFVTPRL